MPKKLPNSSKLKGIVVMQYVSRCPKTSIGKFEWSEFFPGGFLKETFYFLVSSSDLVIFGSTSF